MFVGIRKYTVRRGSAEELARRVQDGFVPLTRQIEGFMRCRGCARRRLAWAQVHRSCAQALSVPPWEFRQRLVWVRVLAVLHPSGIGSLGQHAITLGNQKELNLTIKILDPASGGAGVFR